MLSTIPGARLSAVAALIGAANRGAVHVLWLRFGGRRHHGTCTTGSRRCGRRTERWRGPTKRSGKSMAPYWASMGHVRLTGRRSHHSRILGQGSMHRRCSLAVHDCLRWLDHMHPQRPARLIKRSISPDAFGYKHSLDVARHIFRHKGVRALLFLGARLEPPCSQAQGRRRCAAVLLVMWVGIFPITTTHTKPTSHA